MAHPVIDPPVCDEPQPLAVIEPGPFTIPGPVVSINGAFPCHYVPPPEELGPFTYGTGGYGISGFGF